jgi:hypothetical protein
MASKFTRLTHKIAIQLNLVAESCTICSSHSRRPVRKLLDTPSYIEVRCVAYGLPWLNKDSLKERTEEDIKLKGTEVCIISEFTRNKF